MLESLTADSFRPRLREHFKLQLDDGRLDLELVEVAEFDAGGRAGRAPFSIVFRGPADPALAQGIWKLENDRLGELELFLVPIGPGQYEAVFT